MASSTKLKTSALRHGIRFGRELGAGQELRDEADGLATGPTGIGWETLFPLDTFSEIAIVQDMTIGLLVDFGSMALTGLPTPNRVIRYLLGQQEIT